MKSPKMVQVASSHIEAVDYQPEARRLLVRWKPSKKQAAAGMPGKLSAYLDVPPDVAEQAVKSWSVGSFIQQNIKGVFRHEYVE